MSEITEKPGVPTRLKYFTAYVTSSSQYFELIGTFIHVVTIEEEEESKHNPLRKVKPLIDYVKSKCFEFYQPRQEMSVDERMVKSKARCHLVQYMCNKPVKWGFKLWVLADMSGYTIDFNTSIYTRGNHLNVQTMAFHTML